MENIKRVLSYVRRGVDDYQMIKDGDKISEGVFYKILMFKTGFVSNHSVLIIL